MSRHSLTGGAVGKLLQGVEVQTPVLQILGFKKIAGQGGADRYRVNVSDGVHSHTYAMLATQLNHLVPTNVLETNCIIRVDKMISNTVGEKRVLILLELTVLAKGKDEKKIGNPVQWIEGTAPAANGTGAAPAAPATNGIHSAQPVGQQHAAPQANNNSFYGRSGSMGSSFASKPPSTPMNHHTGPVVPIRDLNPYNSRCSIRARVTVKSDVRAWANAKGEGKLFSFELLDDSGEVRMTGFKNAVDEFYDLLEVGNVYVLSNFQVKPANRAFNKLSHDYELTIGNETQIIPYTEDASSTIPTATYNFVSIARIEGMEKEEIIDVIGICKSKGDVSHFTSRQGKELTKRDIVLVDKSNIEVSVTLWGKQAEDFNDDSEPVIAIKGARIGDFNGRNLSILNSSGFHLNPDISEAHILRGWYDNEGRTTQSRSISGVGRGVTAPWKVLHESTISELADSEKGDFFMAKVTVMSVRRENPAYMACASIGCNRKVIDMNDGSYRCEKCAVSHPNFHWRLTLSVSFGDFSGNVWATCFQETAETLLGHTANEIGPMHKERPEDFDAVIKNALFRSYIVKFRSRVETFNNETRRKANVMELHPLNFAEYATKLATEIKESAY